LCSFIIAINTLFGSILLKNPHKRRLLTKKKLLKIKGFRFFFKENLKFVRVNNVIKQIESLKNTSICFLLINEKYYLTMQIIDLYLFFLLNEFRIF